MSISHNYKNVGMMGHLFIIFMKLFNGLWDAISIPHPSDVLFVLKVAAIV